MSDTERIRPPWWLKYVNKVMIGVQRLGFGFGGKGPVILTVPGRKTGKLALDTYHADDRRWQAVRARRSAGR